MRGRGKPFGRIDEEGLFSYFDNLQGECHTSQLEKTNSLWPRGLNNRKGETKGKNKTKQKRKKNFSLRKKSTKVFFPQFCRLAFSNNFFLETNPFLCLKSSKNKNLCFDKS